MKEKSLHVGALLLALSFSSYAWTGDSWGGMTRTEMQSLADQMIDSSWIPHSTFNNYEYLLADGVTVSRYTYTAGLSYTGIAYGQGSNPQDNWAEFSNYMGITSAGNRSYGNDCSGFVSMCWKLPARQITATFESQIGTYWTSLGSIGSAASVSLLLGDAINSSSDGHILLFLNYQTSGVQSMEQTPHHAMRRVWTYSALQNYRPIRRMQIIGDSDTTSPTVSLTDPNSGTFTVGSQVTLSATAGDASGISYCGYYLTEGINVIGTIYQGSTGSGMVSPYCWTVPATLNGTTLNGTDYKIMVMAWDASPNQNPGGALSSGYLTLRPAAADTTAPSLSITYPANNATVTSASLTVTGTASDSGHGNNGVSSVTVNGVSASGGTASGANTANWSATITLSPGVNTITTVAKDAFNNTVQQQVAVTYSAVPSLPNLTWYQPSGWSAPIVVSKMTGTTADDELTDTDTLYVDWALINSGTASVLSGQQGNTASLYVDGIYKTYWLNPRLDPMVFSGAQDYNIGKLTAGAHTIKIVFDEFNWIAESSETDNSYTKNITVSSSGPVTKIIGLSGSVSFGNVTVGLTALGSFTINNAGNSTLTVNSITYPVGMSGNWIGSIAAGKSQNVIVTFAPSVVTAYSGNIIVNSDATSGGNTISASGAGVANSGDTSLGNAVDALGLTWSQGGAASWFRETAVQLDGSDAAQSGHIVDNQETWMQSTITGPGSLLFWWKVSSESNYDFLQFYVNGQLQEQVSGEVNWNQRAYFLSTTNQYTVKWRYTKDFSLSHGSDAGWVDQVTWTPCPYATHVPQMFYQNPSGMLASWVLNSSGNFLFSRVLANTGGWVLKAAGDIDGDGVSDLLFQNAAGDTGGWFMNADGSVRDARFWFNIGAWEIKACGDYEGTGRGQLFFQTAAGDTAYWRLDTNGVYLSSQPLGLMPGWKLRGVGDLDGDHKAELIWQNASGAIAIWYHNLDGSIRGAVPFNTGNWALCGVADIDGDGVSDLLWQTPSGDTGGWFMNNNSTTRTANFWWNTGTWKLKAAGR